MKNTRVIVLTIFAVLNVISSQNNLGSSFTCASVTNPTKVADCTSQRTNSGNLCCYLSGIQTYSNDRMCVSLPSASYTGAKTYNVNDKTYQIDCGVSNVAAATILNTCGTTDAVGQSTCAVGSSFVNSCCWSDKMKGCYWLGTKYHGKTTWAGLYLDCGASHLAFSLSLLFLFLVFIF